MTESKEPRKYWSVLKNRLKKEGSELTTRCSQLKMEAPDGKIRLRDTLDTEGVFRLIEENLEERLGESVISKENNLNYDYLEDENKLYISK